MAIQIKRKLGQPTAEDLEGLLEGQPLIELSSGDLYIGGSEKRVGESLVDKEAVKRESFDNKHNNIENGTGDKSTRSLGTDKDNKKVRKISFSYNEIGYTIYTVDPDFIIYKNNGVTEKKYSSNKTFTLADGSSVKYSSNSDGVVEVKIGSNDITNDCTITWGDNNITGDGAIGVGRILTVSGRAAQGFGGYNEVNGEYGVAFGYNGKNYSKQSIASGNAFYVTSKYSSSNNIWASEPSYNTDAESSTNLVTGSQLVVGGKGNFVSGRGIIETGIDKGFDKVVESIIDDETATITGYKLRTANVKNLIQTDSTIQGTISGDYNIVAGYGHISLGNSNAVFGASHKIIGNYHNVNGWDNISFGSANTVSGEHNRVSGESITAIGRNLAVNESYNGTIKPKGTTVVGQFNKAYKNTEESPIFAVGSGTDENNRKNAMEVWETDGLHADSITTRYIKAAEHIDTYSIGANSLIITNSVVVKSTDNTGLITTNHIDTDSISTTFISNRKISNIFEENNSTTVKNATNATTLNSHNSDYYLDYNNFTNKPLIATTIEKNSDALVTSNLMYDKLIDPKNNSLLVVAQVLEDSPYYELGFYIDGLEISESNFAHTISVPEPKNLIDRFIWDLYGLETVYITIPNLGYDLGTPVNMTTGNNKTVFGFIHSSGIYSTRSAFFPLSQREHF